MVSLCHALLPNNLLWSLSLLSPQESNCQTCTLPKLLYSIYRENKYFQNQTLDKGIIGSQATHGICHGYTDIIRVKLFVFLGKFLLRTYNVLPKIEFFTFLRSFGDTFICPEAYHGYIYERNTNYIKIYVNQALSYLTMSDFVQVY